MYYCHAEASNYFLHWHLDVDYINLSEKYLRKFSVPKAPDRGNEFNYALFKFPADIISPPLYSVSAQKHIIYIYMW